MTDHAQGARITDAMCEAAIKADVVDRIQGFGYDTHYVIRDVWLDYGAQTLWKISKDDAEAEERFRRQCGIERMRKVLEAALTVSEGDRVSLDTVMKADWPDVTEDDPEVELVAHAIAEHGIGRPWDDFLPTNAYDTDHGDLIEYARAAVAALRTRASLSSTTLCRPSSGDGGAQ